MRCLGDELRADRRVDVDVAVAAQRHDHLLERGVSGALSDAVDRHLGLPGPVEYAAQRVGRRHAQVVVAVGRNNRPVDVGDVFGQIADSGAVLLGQAVARRVGYIDHGGSGGNGRLDDPGEVFDVGTSGILGVELDVIDETAGITHRLDGPFDDPLGCRAQFVVDVLGRDADARVDPLAPGASQRLGRGVDVPLDGASQGADRRFGDRFRDGYYGIEISRTRNGESGLDDIHAEAFEQAGHLDLFRGVQLAAGDLLSVAEGRVENIQFLAHTFVGRLFGICVSEANILRNFQNKTASGGFFAGVPAIAFNL